MTKMIKMRTDERTDGRTDARTKTHQGYNKGLPLVANKFTHFNAPTNRISGGTHAFCAKPNTDVFERINTKNDTTQSAIN